MVMMIVASGLIVRRAKDLRVRHLQPLQSCHFFGRRARFEIPVLVIVVRLLLLVRTSRTCVLLPPVIVPRSRCRRVVLAVPCLRVLVLGRIERLEPPSSAVWLGGYEFRIRRRDYIRRGRAIVVMRSLAAKVLLRRGLFAHTQVDRHIVHPATCILAIGLLLFCTGFVDGLLVILGAWWAASRLHSAEDRFRHHRWHHGGHDALIIVRCFTLQIFLKRCLVRCLRRGGFVQQRQFFTLVLCLGRSLQDAEDLAEQLPILGRFAEPALERTIVVVNAELAVLAIGDGAQERARPIVRLRRLIARLIWEAWGRRFGFGEICRGGWEGFLARIVRCFGSRSGLVRFWTGGNSVLGGIEIVELPGHLQLLL